MIGSVSGQVLFLWECWRVVQLCINYSVLLLDFQKQAGHEFLKDKWVCFFSTLNFEIIWSMNHRLTLVLSFISEGFLLVNLLERNLLICSSIILHGRVLSENTCFFFLFQCEPFPCRQHFVTPMNQFFYNSIF